MYAAVCLVQSEEKSTDYSVIASRRSKHLNGHGFGV